MDKPGSCLREVSAQPCPSLAHTYRVQEGQHSQPLGLVLGFFKAGVVSRVVVDNVQLWDRDGVTQQEGMNGFGCSERQPEGTVTTPIPALCLIPDQRDLWFSRFVEAVGSS